MDTCDPIGILRDYYPAGSRAYELVVRHGEQVAAKALAVAERLAPGQADTDFLHEAAMLHDIGIFLTDTPELACHGKHPYICHGVLGRDLLESRGLYRHALVCERHVGVGLRLEDIRRQNLPLPARDMQPVTLEEEIVCYADKFYSKTTLPGTAARTVAEILTQLGRYGRFHARRFQDWSRRFETGPSPNAPTGRPE